MAEQTGKYSTDELEAPDWMNVHFFQKILSDFEKTDVITVKNLTTTPASMKGDHFGSIMFRVKIEYTHGDELKMISVIVKTIPIVDGIKKSLLEETNMFETEINVYSAVLSKVERILQACGEDTKIAPRCLGSSLSPIKYLIFEDLNELGYSMIRGRHYTLDEVKFAYLKLAKFHAVSLKLSQEHPDIFKKFCHSLFTLKDMSEGAFFKNGVENFVEMLEAKPELAKFKRYFEPMQSGVLAAKCAAISNDYHTNRQSDICYSLCHGDFHFNNAMCKFDQESGNCKDIVLFDYQISFMGPIVFDLIYSFMTILSPEQRRNDIDELLYYYHHHFSETLRKIEYNGQIPKLHDLRYQWTHQKYIHMYALVFILSLTHGFLNGNMDFIGITESNEKAKLLFQNKSYIDELQELMPRLQHMGCYDD